MPNHLTFMLTLLLSTGQAQAAVIYTPSFQLAANQDLTSQPGLLTELDQLYTKTRALLKDHKPDQAIKNLDLMKQLYSNLCRTEKCIRYYFEAQYVALHAVPNGTDYAARKRKADPAFTKKHNEVRQAFISLALKLAPNFDIPHAKQSYMYIEAGNTKQALASINRAIQHNPQYHEYYHARGDLFNQLNSKLSAVNDYKKTIQLLEPVAQQKGPNSIEAQMINFLKEKINLI